MITFFKTISHIKYLRRPLPISSLKHTQPLEYFYLVNHPSRRRNWKVHCDIWKELFYSRKLIKFLCQTRRVAEAAVKTCHAESQLWNLNVDESTDSIHVRIRLTFTDVLIDPSESLLFFFLFFFSMLPLFWIYDCQHYFIVSADFFFMIPNLRLSEKDDICYSCTCYLQQQMWNTTRDAGTATIMRSTLLLEGS